MRIVKIANFIRIDWDHSLEHHYTELRGTVGTLVSLIKSFARKGWSGDSKASWGPSRTGKFSSPSDALVQQSLGIIALLRLGNQVSFIWLLSTYSSSSVSARFLVVRRRQL